MPVILIKPKDVVRQNMNINCRKLEEAMSKVKISPAKERLEVLRQELNSLFKDTNCKSIIYTKNTDKLFFGMCVMPIISAEDVNKILVDNEPAEISKQYLLEFDSRLFEIGLSTRELVAVLLHEIGHIVLDLDRAIDEVSKSLYLYLSKNNETINVERSIKYKEVLAFGFSDAIRKINNIFVDQETTADSYAVALGYGKELESALRKITDRSTNLNREVNNKLLVFQWSLRVYKDIKFKRIPAIRSLQKVYDMTGSELEKKEINSCINNLKKIDDNMLSESAIQWLIHEGKNNFSIFRKFKYKGMRGIEDDLYEYTLRVQSVDQQDEALMILRDINSRLAILDDYLNTTDLDSKEKERWMGVRNKYIMLRQQLSKKTTYDDKYYGLFVKTPVIKSRYEI